MEKSSKYQNTRAADKAIFYAENGDVKNLKKTVFGIGEKVGFFTIFSSKINALDLAIEYIEEPFRPRALKALETLLKAGLDPNSKDSQGDSLLRKAAKGVCHDTIDLLVNNGANANEKIDLNGYSLLEEMCDQKRYSVASLLVAAGADVNQRNIFDYSLLESSLVLNKHETVKFLLENDASPYSLRGNKDPLTSQDPSISTMLKKYQNPKELNQEPSRKKRIRM